MKVRWEEAAAAELREAATFLDKRQRGLGRQLRSRVREVIQRFRSDPTSYEQLKDNIHRCRVKQFQYSVYYAVLFDNSILILALMHHSRHPDYWKHRIPKDKPAE